MLFIIVDLFMHEYRYLLLLIALNTKQYSDCFILHSIQFCISALAYIWPIIIHVIDQPHIQPNDGPIALILCPTRELSKQVAKYAKLYMECLQGKVVEVSGGNKGTWELCKELKRGCEIVVGTPGRVIDVVRKKGTNLERVTFVVLDEADRMLGMIIERVILL